MTLPLSPISAPLSNFSAWQQPFWERISWGHHTDLLNFELECTHTKTHIYMRIKSRHANTLWLMPVPLCISYPRHTVCIEHAWHWRGWGCLPEIQPPTSRPLHFDVSGSPHTLTYFNTDTLSPYQHSLSLSHIHTPLQLLWIFSSIPKQRSHDTI